MLSDLFSFWIEYYQFSLICIETDVNRSQALNNKRKIMINVLNFFVGLLIWRRFVSSAKCSIWLCLIDLCRSFMNIINKSGPNTDLCGTPWEIRYGCELDLFFHVNWILWVKYQWNQLLDWPLIPVCKFIPNIIIHCVKSFFKI